jgi:hypothetical protein
MEGNTVFSWLAIAFEMILYITLQRLIGRNSVTRDGAATLGTKQILVELRPASNDPPH